MTAFLRADFAVLDAYFDMWLQLANGGRVSPDFVQRLLIMPQYEQSLARYRDELGVSRRDLGEVLLSLREESCCAAGPLAVFSDANRVAVANLGYMFDIIFPLRRLRMARTAHTLAVAGQVIPEYIRIMPDLLPCPYLIQNALVVNFFALTLDKNGHIVAGGLPLDTYLAKELHRLVK